MITDRLASLGERDAREFMTSPIPESPKQAPVLDPCLRKHGTLLE
jgi:hypothetical protein